MHDPEWPGRCAREAHLQARITRHFWCHTLRGPRRQGFPAAQTRPGPPTAQPAPLGRPGTAKPVPRRPPALHPRNSAPWGGSARPLPETCARVCRSSVGWIYGETWKQSILAFSRYPGNRTCQVAYSRTLYNQELLPRNQHGATFHARCPMDRSTLLTSVITVLVVLGLVAYRLLWAASRRVPLG